MQQVTTCLPVIMRLKIEGMIIIISSYSRWTETMRMNAAE